MTLKTGLQSTANIVVRTKSYRSLNRFNVNDRFRHAVYVAPDYLPGTASDGMLIYMYSRFDKYRRDRRTDGRTDGQTAFNSIVLGVGIWRPKAQSEYERRNIATIRIATGSILYHFRDKARYWAIFSYPPCIRRHRYGSPRRKNAVSFGMKQKLSCRRESARRFLSLNILLSHSG